MLEQIDQLPESRPLVARRFVVRLQRNDIVAHGLLVFVSSTLVNALGYGFHFLLSRHLGVSSYGDLSALISFLMITSVPSTILATVVAKYVSEFRALNERGKLRTLVTRLFRFLAILGTVAFLGIAAGHSEITQYLHVHDVSAVSVSAYLVGISLVLPVARAVLQGVEDFKAFAISTVFEATAKLGVSVFLVYSVNLGVSGAIAGWCVASSLSLIYTVYIVKRHCQIAKPSRLQLDAQRLLRVSGAIGVYTLLLAVMMNFDTIMVKHFFDARTAGIYAGAALVGKIVLFFVGFIPITILPKVSAKAATGEKSTRMLLHVAVMVAAICVVSLSAYYFAGGLLLRYTLGADFAVGMPYVFPYAIAATVLGLITIVATYKIGLHRFDFVLPLCLAAVGEIITVSLLHRSLLEVIEILIAGHVIALLFCLRRILVPNPSALRSDSGAMEPVL